MIINYENENFKKDVKQEIKKFKPENITLFLDFKYDNIGELAVKLNKKYYNSYVDASIICKFTTTTISNVKQMVIAELHENDVVLDMLLENKVYVDPYFQNLKNLSIGNNGCNYWIDSIVLQNEKRNKRVKHDAISFENVQMITLR